jgi:outer membrane protein OmpA-like peptidoglycan-associated protein
MSKSHSHPDRNRPRAWGLAIFAILAWALLATNAAEAQQARVPEVVLAQVLGRSIAPETTPAPDVAAKPAEVELVAQRMRANFQDQLVAGVSRPSVELEVHFDFDSDQIHEESGPQIEAAAEVLNDHFPGTRFRVAGFTDAAGPEAYNKALSERRAAAVWKQLVEQHGVAPERLERVGFGEDDPAALESDAQRRRVELQILRGDGGEGGNAETL